MADILMTERQTLAFRLLAVLLVGLAFVLAGSGGHAGWVVGLSGGYVAYSLVINAVLRRWRHPLLVYPMILADVAFLGLVGSWSGDAGRLVVVVLPLLVPFYALQGGYVPASVAATVALVVSALLRRGELSPPDLIVQGLFLYLLALLSGYLGRDRGGQLREEALAERLARLEEAIQSLSGAVRTIQEAGDTANILQELALAAPKLTGLPECLIGILDRRTGALVTRATTTELSRLGVERLEYLVEWPRAGSLTSETLASHQPIALRDLSSDGRLLPPWAERLKVEALLAIPLSSHGVDVGVMFFYGVPSGYPFSAREVTLAQTYGDVVAHAAVTGQLYEDVNATVASVMSELRPIVVPRQTQRPRPSSVIELGDLYLDKSNRQVRIGNREINLTPTEFDLLAVLAESPGRAVDQETLLRRVWGDDYNGRPTVVDVGIHRLRRKIEDGSGVPRRIITVRGSGYMLVPGDGISRQGEAR